MVDKFKEDFKVIIDELLKKDPFSLCNQGKKEGFESALYETLKQHLEGSPEYKRWCESQGFKDFNGSIDKIPFIPVQVFKERDLVTVKESDIIDIRHSSSTTSGVPSLVKRDAITIDRYKQSRNSALSAFCTSNKNVQIGVIEDPDENPNPNLSANLILFVIASRTDQDKTFYVVKDNNGEKEVDLDKFLNLINIHKNNISLIFGHMAYIYLFLIEGLKKRGITLNLSDVTMLYGWGWKKYADKAVPTDVFRKSIQEVLGIPQKSILDMYGFAESNSLYLECSEGFRHVPLWDEVLVRCPKSFQVVKDGEEGLLQFLSPIPNSYPGASVLIDDIGLAYHEGVCKCGRKGTKFKLIRRANKDELIAFRQLADSFGQGGQ